MNEMTITSAQWWDNDLTGEAQAMVLATIDGEDLKIPKDLSNRHYAEILRQVEAGTLTIADAD